MKQWILFFGLTLTCLTTQARERLDMNTSQKNGSFNCDNYSKEEFSKYLKEDVDKVVYKPKPHEEKTKVTLVFNLKPMPDTWVTIESSLVKKPVYVGPYYPEITLEVGQEMLKKYNEHPEAWGWDAPRFYFYLKPQNRICTAVQETGYLIWKPNARVHIDFLKQREWDTNIDRPYGYKAWIE
jgi:hypothetical protein